MTGVAVVVPMLNEAHTLPRLARSLAALDPAPGEVLFGLTLLLARVSGTVFVADIPADATEDQLTALFKDVGVLSIGCLSSS